MPNLVDSDFSPEIERRLHAGSIIGAASAGAAHLGMLRNRRGLTLRLAFEPTVRDLARLARRPKVYRLRRARAPGAQAFGAPG